MPSRKMIGTELGPKISGGGGGEIRENEDGSEETFANEQESWIGDLTPWFVAPPEVSHPRTDP